MVKRKLRVSGEKEKAKAVKDPGWRCKVEREAMHEPPARSSTDGPKIPSKLEPNLEKQY